MLPICGALQMRHVSNYALVDALAPLLWLSGYNVLTPWLDGVAFRGKRRLRNKVPARGKLRNMRT